MALAAKATELDKHYWGLCGIAVAELDQIIVPAFQSALPIRCAGAVFGFLAPSGNFSKIFPMKVQVEDTGLLGLP